MGKEDKVNLLAMVRGIFPDVSDKEAQDLLWEHTSFPAYKMNAVKEYRRSLFALRHLRKNGLEQCEFCNKQAKSDDLCKSCGKILERARQERAERQ